MNEETDYFTFLDETEQPDRRHLPFDPWWFALSPKAVDLIDEAVASIEEREADTGTRERRRRPADHASLRKTVEAVICSLIRTYLTSPGAKVYVSRSKQLMGSKCRYRPPPYTAVFPYILDTLEALGWIDQDVGEDDREAGVRTTITAGYEITQRVSLSDLTIDDLGRDDRSEVIVLKRTKADFWDDGAAIPYVDTQRTHELRREVMRINDFLGRADLDLGYTQSQQPLAFDIRVRRLRRMFTQGSFDCGGRLFGGVWQQMTKEQRQNHLFIDGEPCIELDYGQMGARILYGSVGVDPGDKDLYSIPGISIHRNAMKKLFNAMVFSSKPLSRMPVGVREATKGKLTVHDAMDAVMRHHEPIRHLLCVGHGHKAQLTESTIMIDLLNRLYALGITALPIHDAVLVPESMGAVAKEVMLATFKEHTGISGIVS